MASLREEIESRRTFAIISHPDAGKTTLTEKLLLYTLSLILMTFLSIWDRLRIWVVSVQL